MTLTATDGGYIAEIHSADFTTMRGYQTTELI